MHAKTIDKPEMGESSASGVKASATDVSPISHAVFAQVPMKSHFLWQSGLCA